MDTLPWWAFAGLAFLVLYHPEFDAAPWGSRRDAGERNGSPSNADEIQERRLGDAKAPDSNITAPAMKSTAPGLAFNLTVPCVSIPFVGLVAKPCGNVTIGGEGVDIKTLFGKKHIPGTNVLKPYVKTLEKSFERYTAHVVGAVGLLYVLMTLCSTSRREQLVQSIKDTLAGKLETDDPTDAKTDEEEAAELADRMDPKSTNFIAPGNIYRLLAVLHPGKIGYHQWGKFAFKAGVCAYMQLYLPFKIIKNIFLEWTFHGYKSPLWFLSNGATFVTMFISVGSLCNLFAAKCAENIRSGAEANYFILTHGEPHAVVAADAANAQHSPLPQDDADADSRSLALIPMEVPKLTMPSLPMPTLPPCIITANEYLWCCLSMACNIMMSFLLFFAMFFKIATFTGKIGDVAVIAVSLYFVFDMDAKVMDSDPKLRPKYRRAVLKQVVEKPYKPTWLLVIAATSKLMLGMLTPLGLASIVLFSWKSGDVVIGGDPF